MIRLHLPKCTHARAPDAQIGRWAALIGDNAPVVAWIVCVLATGGCERGSSTSQSEPSLQVRNVSLGPARAAPRAASLRFSNRVDGSGIDFTYRDGKESGVCSIVEIVGGGVGVIDLDRDGQVDLILPGGGSLDPDRRQVNGLPTALYQGLGQWKFRSVGKAARIESSRYYSHGALCADFDNDGFDDVLITGYGGLQLFRNQGDGTFQEVAKQTGLTDELWSTSGAWGDFDRDGNLDFYISHYVDWSWDNNPLCNSPLNGEKEVCGPRQFGGLTDSIYYSDGQGGFRDGGSESGLESGGKGLGVLAADLNQDSWLDIYVANDSERNRFYANRGDGGFEEQGLASGLAVGESASENGSMGLALGDFNGDLLLDVWVTNFENESFALYRGLKQPGRFRFCSREAGLTDVSAVYVGWGTALIDLDLDGDEDMPVVNGHVYRQPLNNLVEQPALLWDNQGTGRFLNVGAEAGDYFAERHLGRGLAVADIDQDGLPDLLISNIQEPPALLQNRCTAAANGLTLELIGTTSNRNAIGSLVTLHAGGKTWVRQLADGGSFGTTHQRRMFFGLGDANKIDRLEVRWPNGQSESWSDLPANQCLRIVENQGAPQSAGEFAARGTMQ
jgi:hypothetical protein